MDWNTAAQVTDALSRLARELDVPITISHQRAQLTCGVLDCNWHALDLGLCSEHLRHLGDLLEITADTPNEEEEYMERVAQEEEEAQRETVRAMQEAARRHREALARRTPLDIAVANARPPRHDPEELAPEAPERNELLGSALQKLGAPKSKEQLASERKDLEKEARKLGYTLVTCCYDCGMPLGLCGGHY